MTFKQTFTVVGSFHFPVDMLRYDRACPNSETDSHKIMDSIAELPGFHGTKEIGIIRFISHKTDMPTAGRWQSFGWQIKADTLKTEKFG
jgi:hypothetical protein